LPQNEKIPEQTLFVQGRNYKYSAVPPWLRLKYNRHSPESINPCPANGGLPYAPTKIYLQGVGSGVYLHIHQQPLSPTAASLVAGLSAGHAEW